MTGFQRATPVLRSAEYGRSREFYTTSLGFSVVEEGGDPPRFGIFRRGPAFAFVNAWDGGPPTSPGGWDAYFHVEDADELYAEFEANGTAVIRPPETTVYGMREIEVADPDGNVLCFGSDADGG